MEKYSVFDCTMVELDKHHSDRKGNLTVVVTFEKLPRPLESCVMEWEAHNLLWYYHLFRDHTTDVDINDDESKIRLIIYSILSLIYRRIWKKLTH